MAAGVTLGGNLFKGIKDAKTGQVLHNDSYDSGYFDGVKLGGVRIDVDVICGEDRCTKNEDDSYTYFGNRDLQTLDDAINPDKNKQASGLYGPTGGYQPVQGGWYLGNLAIPYKKGSFSDMLVEGFAGTHDYLGGQLPKWYDKQGNTSQKNSTQEFLADRTTEIAIPIAAPFAVSDLISSDMMEVLFKLGGN